MKTAAAFVLALLLAAPAFGTALANGDEHYERAIVHYNMQNWDEALRGFKLSYELDPKPGTLWSIAQTQRLSGDCRAAILTFRAYARVASPAGAAAAYDHISRCQTALEEQRRAVDQSLNTAPRPPLSAPPSNAQAEPAPRTERPGIERAPGLVRDSSGERDSGRERDSGGEGAWYRDPFAHVLLATGLAGVVVGASFLRRGNTDMREAPHASDYGSYEETRRTAQRKRAGGVAGLSSGLSVALLSVLRFALLMGRDDSKAEASVGVAASARGGHLAYRTTF